MLWAPVCFYPAVMTHQLFWLLRPVMGSKLLWLLNPSVMDPSVRTCMWICSSFMVCVLIGFVPALMAFIIVLQLHNPWWRRSSFQLVKVKSAYEPSGRRGGLMVSALVSGSSGPGSSPGRGHCVVFLGKTLNSHCALLHPGV